MNDRGCVQLQSDRIDILKEIAESYFCELSHAFDMAKVEELTFRKGHGRDDMALTIRAEVIKARLDRITFKMRKTGEWGEL